MTRIVIFGAGAWGTALANVCARKGGETLLWGRNPEAMARLDRERENRLRLPGVGLDARVRCLASIDETAHCDFALAAVPAQSFRDLVETVKSGGGWTKPFIICAKGIERRSGKFLSQVLAELLPEAQPSALSGPSFAIDVASGLPTAVTIAAREPGLAERLAGELSAPGFRLYHSTDLRGVEIGGAAKNVLAIACGIAAGRGLGASALAALIARGFAEMRRYGQAFGAQADTLMGLSGLGDLVLTCGSAQSRNYAFGSALGAGASIEAAAQGKLAEGRFTAPILVETAREAGVELPISAAVAAIVENRLDVAAAIDALLARPLKAE